ncbi:zinc finger CCCH domain-containing protein 3 isoform X3 [Amborella trichopoda]|uniref:zinc finger CCCH domain-containing protein 3 isoform X3 n=2 Tax=Amborella trichopoda TaxID=13333 RepID=UPI0009C0A16E|nr:zinc finger CCCH domain-containing protein 3 isoform X3 [Amborella trichopoda]|eukprot:XP_020521149.1 zinc finger CCCH domain-containing protein 3 isoform X3 [Amborella trichopoda]
MPLGKYYCDYCDKPFQDTPAARKRHLEGLHHQRAKALWYASFKEPHRIQSDGLGRGFCNHFMRTGFCQYGDACKYIHTKPVMQFAGPLPVGNPGSNMSTTFQSSATFGNQSMRGSFPGNTITERVGLSLANLPPSLRPPPEGGYPELPFMDWVFHGS